MGPQQHTYSLHGTCPACADGPTAQNVGMVNAGCLRAGEAFRRSTDGRSGIGSIAGMQAINDEITGGSEQRGGVNPAQTTQKPDFNPPGQSGDWCRCRVWSDNYLRECGAVFNGDVCRNGHPRNARTSYMVAPVPRLSLAEYERLAKLAEECGEVVQIIGKILRHGFESHNPLKQDGETNREMLARELGNLEGWANYIKLVGDVNRAAVDAFADKTVERALPYLHYQPEDLLKHFRNR